MRNIETGIDVLDREMAALCVEQMNDSLNMARSASLCSRVMFSLAAIVPVGGGAATFVAGSEQPGLAIVFAAATGVITAFTLGMGAWFTMQSRQYTGFAEEDEYNACFFAQSPELKHT